MVHAGGNGKSRTGPPPASPRHQPQMDLCGVWYGRGESL
jgi:hypothetical protein